MQLARLLRVNSAKNWLNVEIEGRRCSAVVHIGSGNEGQTPVYALGR